MLLIKPNGLDISRVNFLLFIVSQPYNMVTRLSARHEPERNVDPISLWHGSGCTQEST